MANVPARVCHPGGEGGSGLSRGEFYFFPLGISSHQTALQATGGASSEDLFRLRARIFESPAVKEEPAAPAVTVSLKSVLAEVVHSDAANQLCRRVRPFLDQRGIVTFKKHHALHILKADAERVKELGAGLM